ncbi:MAG: DNA-3-methyladenine glycosylase I, partial [Gammaproteobacteria bacterium]
MASAQQKPRCGWCDSSDLYRQYHDEEWGVPLTQAQSLFRLLMLEGQQAGLSWITVLKKRAHMDLVFSHFDIDFLATEGAERIWDWLHDPGIMLIIAQVNQDNDPQLVLESLLDETEGVGASEISEQDVARARQDR